MSVCQSLQSDAVHSRWTYRRIPVQRPGRGYFLPCSWFKVTSRFSQTACNGHKEACYPGNIFWITTVISRCLCTWVTLMWSWHERSPACFHSLPNMLIRGRYNEAFCRNWLKAFRILVHSLQSRNPCNSTLGKFVKVCVWHWPWQWSHWFLLCWDSITLI